MCSEHGFIGCSIILLKSNKMLHVGIKLSSQTHTFAYVRVRTHTRTHTHTHAHTHAHRLTLCLLLHSKACTQAFLIEHRVFRLHRTQAQTRPHRDDGVLVNGLSSLNEHGKKHLTSRTSLNRPQLRFVLAQACPHRGNGVLVGGLSCLSKLD